MKIHFIGFSVSHYGEISYPLAYQKIATEKGVSVDVSISAFGGLSIDFLSYSLDYLVDSVDSDLVVLEVATSYYSLENNNFDNAFCNIKAIIDKLALKNKKCIFLNLYRRDISDNDIVIQAINKVQASHGIPSLNLKSIYRERLNNHNNDGTVDGIHPEPETILEIGKFLFDYIHTHTENNLERQPIQGVGLEGIRQLNFFAGYKGLRLEFPVTGLSNSYIPIYGDQILRYEFDNYPFIDGLVFLFSPESMNITITLYQPDGSKIDRLIQGFDDNSFYTRVGFNFIPNNFRASAIEIKNSPRFENIQLRREPWGEVGNLCSKIIAVATRQ